MKVKIAERHPDCPNYSIGDKVVMVDRRHHKRVHTIFAEWAGSNNHFLLHHVDGHREVLHPYPYSWRQFRPATESEILKGERDDG